MYQVDVKGIFIKFLPSILDLFLLWHPEISHVMVEESMKSEYSKQLVFFLKKIIKETFSLIDGELNFLFGGTSL